MNRVPGTDESGLQLMNRERLRFFASPAPPFY